MKTDPNPEGNGNVNRLPFKECSVKVIKGSCRSMAVIEVWLMLAGSKVGPISGENEEIIFL